MGFFKQVKDMKAMVAETPQLLEQSSQLIANAQAQAAAQEAAAQQAAAAAGTAPETPVDGLVAEPEPEA